MADASMIQSLRESIAALEAEPVAATESKKGFSKGPARSSNQQAPKESTERTERTEDDNRRDAFSRIVSIVNASDKSEKTIRERLTSLGYGEIEVEEAIEKAKGYAIIDDARYAEVLVRSRISQGRGLAGIARELEQNDIEPDSLDFWLEVSEQREDEEFSRALDFLNRKPPRSKNLREGAYRKLVQKGYSTSVASSAARAWVDSIVR